MLAGVAAYGLRRSRQPSALGRRFTEGKSRDPRRLLARSTSDPHPTRHPPPATRPLPFGLHSRGLGVSKAPPILSSSKKKDLEQISNSIQRDKKRRNLVYKHETQRIEYKSLISNSSVVERVAVNHQIVGSSPTWGDVAVHFCV